MEIPNVRRVDYCIVFEDHHQSGSVSCKLLWGSGKKSNTDYPIIRGGQSRSSCASRMANDHHA